MESNDSLKEFLLILIAAVILALSVAHKNTSILLETFVFFIIILGSNILVKKFVGYLLEIKVQARPWSWYRFGFRKDAHFKRPLPMIWLPLIISLFSKGFLYWLAILEFDVKAKTERVSRRHGLYRFTEVTEWHLAWIAVWGIIINLFLAVIGYLIGFEVFARYSIFFAVWSIVPLSSLDGSKILFGSRGLWVTITTIVLGFLFWGLAIV